MIHSKSLRVLYRVQDLVRCWPNITWVSYQTCI